MHDVSLILLLGGCIGLYSFRDKATADVEALFSSLKALLKSAFTRRSVAPVAPMKPAAPVAPTKPPITREMASARQFYAAFEIALSNKDMPNRDRVGNAAIDGMRSLLSVPAPATGGTQ